MTFSDDAVLVDLVTVHRIQCLACGDITVGYTPTEDDAQRKATEHRLGHRFMESHGARRRPTKKEK